MRFSKPMDRIKVRVSRDEKGALIGLARSRGMTLSDLLREGAKVFAEQVVA